MKQLILISFLFLILIGCNESEDSAIKKQYSDSLNNFPKISKDRIIENREGNIFRNCALSDTFSIIKGVNDMIIEYKYNFDIKNSSDCGMFYSIYFEIPELEKIQLHYSYNLPNNVFVMKFNYSGAWNQYDNKDLVASNITFDKFDTNEVVIFIDLHVKEKIELQKWGVDSIKKVLKIIKIDGVQELIHQMKDTIIINKQTTANTKQN